jgi:leucyl aminopeptidase (aminopeptidase T)
MGQRPVEYAPYRSIPAAKYVKKPLEPNVEAGDEVLIITDTDHDPRVWQTIAAALRDLDAHPVVSLFETREMDYYDPPTSVAEQMKHVDVVVTCTTTAALHSPAGHEAMAAGVPIVTMDGGITLDMLTKGAATADYREIEEITYRVAREVFEGGSEARLTSEYGSDLTLSIEDRVFVPDEPDPDGEVGWPLKAIELRPGFTAAVFPGGEFNVPPDPTTANGTLVIDTTMHTLGRIEQPIEIEIDTGEIVDIRGGYQARELERLLAEYGDADAYKMPTEFSVGTNPEARVTGVQREDKVMLGCIHVGLGTNADVGGEVRSKLHMDGVIARPTLEIDGEMKIDRGKILALED